MVFTTFGREQVAIMLGSEVTGDYIRYVSIGDGSGTEANSNITLVNETKRVEITGSPDFTTSRKVLFQADLNSVQFSGLTLKEFGLFPSRFSGLDVGSLYQREQLVGSIVGDGTIEIRIESAIEIM